MTAHGYDDTLSYLRALAIRVLEETALSGTAATTGPFGMMPMSWQRYGMRSTIRRG